MNSDPDVGERHCPCPVLVSFCPYFLSDIWLSGFCLSRFCPLSRLCPEFCKKSYSLSVCPDFRCPCPPTSGRTPPLLKSSLAWKSWNYDPILFVTLSIVQRRRRFDKWRIFEQNSRTNWRRNDCCKYQTVHRKLTTKYEFRFNSILKMVMTLWISIRYQIVWQ